MANKIISFGDVWSKKVLVLLGVPIFCVIRTMLDSFIGKNYEHAPIQISTLSLCSLIFCGFGELISQLRMNRKVKPESKELNNIIHCK